MAINYKMDTVANSLDAGVCKPKDYSASALSNSKSEPLENNNKVKLNFGVDRLLSNNNEDFLKSQNQKNLIFLNNNQNVPNMTNNNHTSDLLNNVNSQIGLNLLQFPLSVANGLYTSSNQNFVLKPFPLRIGGGSQNGLELQRTQQQQHHHQHFMQTSLRKIAIPTTNPFPFSSNAFSNMLRIPSANQNQQFSIYNGQKFEKSNIFLNESSKNCNGNGSNGHVKRKRSWSRAVFSNLQRKGLERQFEVQKYITKPDRKKLASRLGLKDAQVKVWFQNRRMKWRHTSRNQNASNKPVDDITSDLTDDLEKFTSSSEDDNDEIDVVTDN